MKNTPEDIRELEKKINDLQQKEHKKNEDSETSNYTTAAKLGFQITTELLSGVLIGASLGYFLDKLLDLRPLFLVAFLLLGGAAGILNVYNTMKNEEQKNDNKE